MCESRRVLCNEISMQCVSNLIVFSCDATMSFNGSVLIPFFRSQRCVRIDGVIEGVAVTSLLSREFSGIKR